MAPEASAALTADPSAALDRDLKHSFVGLTEYVGRPAFGRLIDDLYELPLDERPRFVDEVVLEPEQRQWRGIVEPDGIVVQRSTFADGRPTLFCVSKKLPPGHGWHKITVTFDDDGMVLGG